MLGLFEVVSTMIINVLKQNSKRRRPVVLALQRRELPNDLAKEASLFVQQGVN